MNQGHYLRIEEESSTAHVSAPNHRPSGFPYDPGHAPVVDVVLQSPYNHAVMRVLHSTDEVLAWLRERVTVTASDEARLRRICQG